METFLVMAFLLDTVVLSLIEAFLLMLVRTSDSQGCSGVGVAVVVLVLLSLSGFLQASNTLATTLVVVMGVSTLNMLSKRHS